MGDVEESRGNGERRRIHGGAASVGKHGMKVMVVWWKVPWPPEEDDRERGDDRVLVRTNEEEGETETAMIVQIPVRVAGNSVETDEGRNEDDDGSEGCCYRIHHERSLKVEVGVVVVSEW